MMGCILSQRMSHACMMYSSWWGSHARRHVSGHPCAFKHSGEPCLVFASSCAGITAGPTSSVQTSCAGSPSPKFPFKPRYHDALLLHHELQGLSTSGLKWQRDSWPCSVMRVWQFKKRQTVQSLKHPGVSRACQSSGRHKRCASWMHRWQHSTEA